MIILDTNVVSAFMRAELEPRVSGWLDGQKRNDVFTTSITIYEIRYGIDLMSVGSKGSMMEAALAKVIGEAFDGRVLPLDVVAAQMAGAIAARLKKLGRSSEIRDCQIAGVAMAKGATLATRNTRHFDSLGLSLIDPWIIAI